jgi:hypothetical protein
MAADAQDVNIGVAAAELDGDAMAQQAESGCCSCLPSASWIGYCTLSALAAVLAVYHAFDSRDSMYSALVFLSTSKVSLTVSESDLTCSGKNPHVEFSPSQPDRTFLGPFRDLRWEDMIEGTFAIACK